MIYENKCITVLWHKKKFSLFRKFWPQKTFNAIAKKIEILDGGPITQQISYTRYAIYYQKCKILNIEEILLMKLLYGASLYSYSVYYLKLSFMT